MGSPNTYTFRCPNCNRINETQVPGFCRREDLSMVCECEASKVEGNEEVCYGCGVVIGFKKKICLREVSIMIPELKEK